MSKDLSVFPEQTIQKIQETIRKAIDYGTRIIEWGSEDEIDYEIAKEELDNAILNRFLNLLYCLLWKNCPPNNEKDVHIRIEGLLRCIYNDLETKRRISKRIKCFEPDTAIPSLKTLIEYKYITNRSQGKDIVDQVLADISGYQSDDYDNYIFVIYETHRFFPKTDWDKMIESCNPQNRIECVVIKGVAPTKKAKP